MNLFTWISISKWSGYSVSRFKKNHIHELVSGMKTREHPMKSWGHPRSPISVLYWCWQGTWLSYGCGSFLISLLDTRRGRFSNIEAGGVGGELLSKCRRKFQNCPDMFRRMVLFKSRHGICVGARQIHICVSPWLTHICVSPRPNGICVISWLTHKRQPMADP